jgi:hypothetical protein
MGRALLIRLVASCACVLAGCQTTIYSLKIPLSEGSEVAVLEDSPRVIIDDQRPATERKTHLGKEIWSCERWFGDETFLPSKLVYLDQRIAERSRADMQIHIRLTRFDIIEFCEFSATGNSATARSAGRAAPVFIDGAVNGDTVVLHLSGEINGVPFDSSRQFDYGTLYSFPNTPSSSASYRALLRSRLEEAIDEIVGIVWRAEASKNVDSLR